MGRGDLPAVACLFAADSLRAFVAYHGKADVYLSHILGAYPVSSGNADPPPTKFGLSLCCWLFHAQFFQQITAKQTGNNTRKNGYKRN